MNATTADVVWREKTGPASLISVGDHLVLLGQETGEMQIATVSPTRFTGRHGARLLEAGVRAVTGRSFGDGRLYVRNLKEIAALRVN